MPSYLLGIDIGTTATKTILADTDGRIIADASAPATLHAPRAGWAEEDPQQWWANVGSTVRDCLSKANLAPGDVAAVGVSGMVPTVVLLDAEGQVLRPSIQQNDARAYKEIVFFQSQTDEESVLNCTGSAITQQSIGPKLLWLWRNEPELMAQASHVMGSYDYVNFRLTGQRVIESNWALESGLYDLHRADWDEELLALAQVDSGWFGTLHAPSNVIGSLTAEAAAHTGLREGTLVVAGSADHIASAFSAGLRDQGDLLVKLGGAGDILYVLDDLDTDPRLYVDYHVIPDKYLINGCMAASGSIIKWFRSEFAPDMDYAVLDTEAAQIPVGSEGLLLLPYFIGEKTPICDPIARGVLFGLTLRHTRAHVFRAVLEAISYGFYHHLQVLSEMGYTTRRVRVTNGGARSHLWKQITADVLGLDLEQIAHHPGSSLGAAFVAGMGIQAFDGWEDIEKYIEVSAVVEPDPDAHSTYQELYALYRELYAANSPLFGKLSLWMESQTEIAD